MVFGVSKSPNRDGYPTSWRDIWIMEDAKTLHWIKILRVKRITGGMHEAYSTSLD
jgi:hypothetical protein